MPMVQGWARFIAIADKNVLAIVPFLRAYSQLLFVSAIYESFRQAA
jgi:hypothetical protein